MATTAQVNAFINLIAPIVQKKCKEHGWGVPSAIIAQAGLESAWNTSGLSKSCFNYFGMKWVSGCGCEYKAYQTGEQKSDGTRYTVVAKFRKYNSVEEGIEGYFKFIESYKRYKAVMASHTYVEYATQLKACGWATSLKYTQNIINTLEKHNLQKYDTDIDSYFYPQYSGSSCSIVSVLKSLGETDTSFAHRKQIALANGFQTYSGTDSENNWLVGLAKGGSLKRA